MMKRIIIGTPCQLRGMENIKTAGFKFDLNFSFPEQESIKIATVCNTKEYNGCKYCLEYIPYFTELFIIRIKYRYYLCSLIEGGDKVAEDANLTMVENHSMTQHIGEISLLSFTKAKDDIAKYRNGGNYLPFPTILDNRDSSESLLYQSFFTLKSHIIDEDLCIRCKICSRFCRGACIMFHNQPELKGRCSLTQCGSCVISCPIFFWLNWNFGSYIQKRVKIFYIGKEIEPFLSLFTRQIVL